MGLIEYQIVAPGDVDADEWLEFYRRQNHWVPGSAEKLRRMVGLSSCVITAREDGRLVGVARGVADGLRGYLAECKLDPACQGPGAVTRTNGRVEHDERGIAREMALRVIERLRELGVERIDVTAHGTEEDFCADLGFRRSHGSVAMQMDPRSLESQRAAKYADDVRVLAGEMPAAVGGLAARALAGASAGTTDRVG